MFLHQKFKEGLYYFCAVEKNEKQKAKYGVDAWKSKVDEVKDAFEIAKELFKDLDYEEF